MSTSQEVFMQPYACEVKAAMKEFYNSLNEKDCRRYAGIEALKLGRGGRSYIARILGCSRRTVSKGAKEVSGLSGKEVYERIRKPGGGRKSYKNHWAEIDEKFLQVLRDHTAGDPMDETVRWTNLSTKEITAALREDHSIKISKWVVRKLLKKHNYRRRKAQKRCTWTPIYPRRDTNQRPRFHQFG
jgi:transposase